MYYVYSKHIPTGKVNYLNQFETETAAVCHVAKCYRVDSYIRQTGEYYYFIKEQ